MWHLNENRKLTVSQRTGDSVMWSWWHIAYIEALKNLLVFTKNNDVCLFLTYFWIGIFYFGYALSIGLGEFLFQV